MLKSSLTVLLWLCFLTLSNAQLKNNIQLEQLGGESFSTQELARLSVFFFLSPECPLCENYTKDINEYVARFSGDEIDFYGVIPGEFFTRDTVVHFIKTYRVDKHLKVIFDNEYKLTESLNANITPEVFVVNNKGEILYSGKIDNWIISLGNKRREVTEFYLKDALEAIIANQPIAISKTKAIGCYIE